jgi:hypothetical protein
MKMYLFFWLSSMVFHGLIVASHTSTVGSLQRFFKTWICGIELSKVQVSDTTMSNKDSFAGNKREQAQSSLLI